MTWFKVGAASIAVVSAASSQNSANARVAKQSVAENEAIIESNIANTIRTGYKVGLANMQRGLQKKQTVQQGFNISRVGEEALGQASANAAASGTIGASVDATLNDVKMKVGEAQAQLQNQAEIDAANFNTTLTNITTEGAASIKSARKLDSDSEGSGLGGALLAGVSSFASSYLKSNMTLGSGVASATPIASSLTSMGGGTGISGGLSLPTSYSRWGL